MKNKNIFLLALAFTSFCIAGCTTAVPYSFAQDERETATITFYTNRNKEGVDLQYFEDIELPFPEKSNYWAPVIFPAGRPFKLTVNVYRKSLEKGDEKIFNCPALTAGNDYILEYKPSRLLGLAGNKLILTDMKTKKSVYEQQL